MRIAQSRARAGRAAGQWNEAIHRRLYVRRDSNQFSVRRDCRQHDQQENYDDARDELEQ